MLIPQLNFIYFILVFKSLLDFISKKSLKKSLLNFFWMLWPEFIGARHILSQLFVHVFRRCASPLGRLNGASRVWQPRQQPWMPLDLPRLLWGSDARLPGHSSGTLLHFCAAQVPLLLWRAMNPGRI